MRRESIAVSVMALLLIGPLLVGIVLILSDPSPAAVRMIGVSYGAGLALGALVVANLWLRGSLSGSRKAPGHRDVYILVSAGSVPAAILLPIFLGGDIRAIIALFFSGFIAPAVPIVIHQLLHRSS